MHTLWILFQILVGYHLIFPLVLLLLYSAGSRFGRRHDPAAGSGHESDYGIIVTAYEQTAQLPAVVNSLLALRYDRYQIYVVADACDISDLNFESERVTLLRPEKTLASNTRSHFYAIDRFIRPHGRLTVIDSDNLVHPEYLNALDACFNNGFQAVQGIREAKNLNTGYACLDAARDKYYHFYDGRLLFGAGASATLAGSGMAFTTELYDECLRNTPVAGAGFDKVLQYQLVKRGHRIAFAPLAIVWDQKTAKADQLVSQRARWIRTWFRFFRYGFSLMMQGLAGGSWNQFLFGVVLLRPPLFIFLVAGLSLLCFNLAFHPAAAVVWSAAFLAFVASFVLALICQPTDRRIWQSLAGIPRFILLQLYSLIQMRQTDRQAVATRHNSCSADPKI